MSLSRIGYESRRLLARILARIKLNRVRTVHTANGDRLLKNRRWASSIAVKVGNWYLRSQGADVQVLSTDEWLRWELIAWSATQSNASNDHNTVSRCTKEPSVRSNSLLIPIISGEPLSHLLADTGHLIGTRLQYVGWALNALEHLHSRKVDWGDGFVQAISHGDATVENVIVDVSNRRAIWIDFDTRHRTTLPSIERHADDLRALIFSAAVHLQIPQFQPLSVQLRASYRNQEVIAQLVSRLASDWHRPSTFQLAQAPLPFVAAQELGEALAANLVRDNVACGRLS